MTTRRRTLHALCAGLALALAAGTADAQEVARRRALLFAVNLYSEAGVPELQFAERDAKRLAARLDAQGYLTSTFLAKDVTREVVVRELLQLQEQLGPNDTFVLYFAGHGVRRLSNRQVYWLNYDGNPFRPDINGLRLRHLMELVREIPAGRKLVLLDHCYAGDVPSVLDAIGDGTRDSSSAAPVLGSMREAVPVEFDGDLRASQPVNDPATSLFVLAASIGVAFETVERKHGVFTTVLLDAIDKRDADVGADGTVTLEELWRYVRTQVPQRSENRQRSVAVQPSSGDPLAGLDWMPFIRPLDAGEIPAARQRYVDRLALWTNRQLITPAMQTLCEQLLQRWAAAPTALSPTDEKAVAILRLHMDAPPPIDDAQIAAQLAFLIGVELEP